MTRSMPQWQPNERECLRAILETMIDEGVLATRKKLGHSVDVTLVDTEFGINFGLDGQRLPQKTEIMQMLVDFLPYFWLPGDTLWSCPPLKDVGYTPPPVIEHLMHALRLDWRPEGNLILLDQISPWIAALFMTYQPQVQRIITLIGPSLHYACTAWNLQPEQYKALISRDTLELLDPHVRWNMIYGSRIL